MKTLDPNHLTKQQQYILFLFYRFRFLDIPTLQQLLKHKLPTRIQSWVKDLTEKGHLHRFYDTSSFYGRTQPALYCLTSKSKHVLQRNSDCEKSVLQNLYREKDRSRNFQLHCRMVAHVLLFLSKMSSGEDQKIAFYTRNELVSYPHFPSPLPDAFLAKKNKNRTTHRYFLEVIDETLPKRVVRLKLKRYFTAYQGDWAEMTDNSKFPTILLIVSNMNHLRKVRKILQMILDEEYDTLQFYISTLDHFLERDSTSISWEEVKSTFD